MHTRTNKQSASPSQYNSVNEVSGSVTSIDKTNHENKFLISILYIPFTKTKFFFHMLCSKVNSLIRFQALKEK